MPVSGILKLEVLQQHFHVVTYDQEGCHSDSELLPMSYSIHHMACQILDLLINDGIREFGLSVMHWADISACNWRPIKLKESLSCSV